MSASHAGPPRASRPVQVTKCALTGAHIFRFRGNYLGCMLHWPKKGGAIPCVGRETCTQAHTGLGLSWRGFAPGDEFFPKENMWWPTVIEISEAWEWDLRGRDLRGEEWHLTRKVQGDKSSEWVGTFIGMANPKNVGEWFDVQPVLDRAYHYQPMKTDFPNPLPQRVVMAGTPGDGPPVLEGFREVKLPDLSAEEIREKLKGRLPAGYSKPEVAPNGRIPAHNGNGNGKH